MELKPFLDTIPIEMRDKFASDCGTSWAHLRNVGYGDKTCSPTLAVLIEAKSKQVVRRWDCRPDDWHRIWPELRRVKGAPEVPAAA